MDYVVNQVRRFALEMFPQAEPTPTSKMKGVGELEPIGCILEELLQKCLRSLESGLSGLGGNGKLWRIGARVNGDRDILVRNVMLSELSMPNARPILFIRNAPCAGLIIEQCSPPTDN